MISNCGTPTEEAFVFFRKSSKSYYARKLVLNKRFSRLYKQNGQIGDIPENTVLVTADVVGLKNA